MLYYFLQLNLYTVLFYGIYCLLPGRSSSYCWRRHYLLWLPAVAVLLPFLYIRNLFDSPAAATAGMEQLKEFVVGGVSQAVTIPTDWWLYGYLLVVLLLLLRLGLQYRNMVVFLSRCPMVRVQGIRTVLNSTVGPASFFRTILLPGNEADPALFRHEAAHVHLGHHYDRLYLNVLCCIFFPVLPFYAIRKELELVHEFQADAAACDDRDAYAALLLNEHFQTSHFSVMQHFFQHPLKQRIMMLQQNTPIRKGRKYLLILLTTLSTGSILALQSCTQKEPDSPRAVSRQSKEVFKEVAQKPGFTGGDQELFRFLGDNIKYPAHEQELRIEGTVLAGFVVDDNGNIKDIEIKRSVSPALDQEVIRVIKAMPAWQPGRNDKGETVCVYFQLPVTFRLAADKVALSTIDMKGNN